MRKDADEVAAWLVARLAAVFDLPPGRVHGGTALDDLGIDSITRAGLAREIEQRFKVTLDPDALHEFPTIQSLADHVAAH